MKFASITISLLAIQAFPIVSGQFIEVTSGSAYCEIVNGCVTDGYGNHGNNEACTMRATVNGRLSATEFNTEAGYDFINVNGVDYAGAGAGPQNIDVVAGTEFTWRSDGSVTRSGWTLCLEEQFIEVTSGSAYCEIVNGCVTDGYGNHGNNEACTMRATVNGRLSATEFNTEAGYDFINVNGVDYAGAGAGPQNIDVVAGTEFTWRSDGSVTRSGWTLCLDPEFIQVTSGSAYCEIVNGCVTDGYGNHGNNEGCTMRTTVNGILSATEFNTEAGYDFINVNGVDYAGSGAGPQNVGVSAGAEFTWRSDGSVTRSGWTLCLYPTLEITSLPISSPTSSPTSSQTLPLTLSPISSPTSSPISSPSGAYGDPHIKMWTGEQFDFHGICDLVLVSNPEFGNEAGLDVHIRTKKMRQWSYVGSAAVRIGTDILEVRGGETSHFWINGIQGNSNTGKMVISNYPIQYYPISKKSEKFVVDLGDGEGIVFKTWNSFVSVKVENPKMDKFVGSVGLMGSFPEGRKIGRENRIIEDINIFGQEWQVLSSEQNLFHDIEGPQHPQHCEIPSSTEMRRRLAESLMTVEEAEKACIGASLEDKELCIFDVMATNDQSSAGAY